MAHTCFHDAALLATGRHGHPRTGMCLLEAVSTLPGGPWTDRPRTVDPILGVLARAVNDRTSDAERPALAQLIPWLAAMPPVPHDRCATAISHLVVNAAVPFTNGAEARALRSGLEAATDVRAVPGLRGWVAQRRRRAAACRVARTGVRVLARSGDRALRDVLIRAVDEARRLGGGSGLPPLSHPASSCQGVLAVLWERRVPDVPESMYYHCNALLDRWPEWLQQGWRQACDAQRGSERDAEAIAFSIPLDFPFGNDRRRDE